MFIQLDKSPIYTLIHSKNVDIYYIENLFVHIEAIYTEDKLN